MAHKDTMNRFAVLAPADDPVTGSPVAGEHMTEVIFACYSGVVGQLAGRDWKYIKTLCEDYREMFGGRNVSITYDGAHFRVHLSSYAPGIEFIVHEFGQRVAMANLGIVAEPAGAIIGRGGWWLRKAESDQCVQCTIYHEDGCFFVKFPWSVSTASRIVAIDDIRRKLMGRAQFMNKTLSESASTASLDSAPSHLEDFLQGHSPRPGEAHH